MCGVSQNVLGFLKKKNSRLKALHDYYSLTHSIEAEIIEKKMYFCDFLCQYKQIQVLSLVICKLIWRNSRDEEND